MQLYRELHTKCDFSVLNVLRVPAGYLTTAVIALVESSFW